MPCKLFLLFIPLCRPLVIRWCIWRSPVFTTRLDYVQRWKLVSECCTSQTLTRECFHRELSSDIETCVRAPHESLKTIIRTSAPQSFSVRVHSLSTNHVQHCGVLITHHSMCEFHALPRHQCLEVCQFLLHQGTLQKRHRWA